MARLGRTLVTNFINSPNGRGTLRVVKLSPLTNEKKVMAPLSAGLDYFLWAKSNSEPVCHVLHYPGITRVCTVYCI